MPKAKPKKSWTVTTSGDRPLGDVAKDLRKSGFKVDELMTEIGIITGEAPDGAAAKARKVKGVTDVSSTPTADVGPPDSSDTW
jgi:hypothetical protein